VTAPFPAYQWIREIRILRNVALYKWPVSKAACQPLNINRNLRCRSCSILSINLRRRVAGSLQAMHNIQTDPVSSRLLRTTRLCDQVVLYVCLCVCEDTTLLCSNDQLLFRPHLHARSLYSLPYLYRCLTCTVLFADVQPSYRPILLAYELHIGYCIKGLIWEASCRSLYWVVTVSFWILSCIWVLLFKYYNYFYLVFILIMFYVY